jgi:cytochrome c-type biogenesis protein CcmF
MLGGILIKVAFVFAVLSVAGYIRHHLKATDRSLLFGRSFFHGTVVLIAAASATLLYLILTHQFQYSYVWSYSSRALSTPLLISTFYAGQEGSFMLWALFTAVIGIFLLRHSSRVGYEAQVMSVFMSIELLLLVMLLVKSPFLYVWESFAEVGPGFVPADGRGLNPLLQNYWMVIHPQVLFSGFAAMAVPYSYAMAALLKRDYDHWYKPAMPWIAFGVFVLGLGIMMGGYWAYETLGWGGYWAWDPVENSSLVPWLFALALVHTILSQRQSGAFARTNLVLGMLCFILVVYSTFLTRSGVLGDTSVHSFAEPGMWAYWLLVGMLFITVVAPAVLMARRWKEIPRRPAKHSYYSREFALFLGASTLAFIAVFVIVGTSSPIITELLYGKKSAVDISYYATTVIPLGIILALLMGLGQLLWWTRSERAALLRGLIVPAGIALLSVPVMLHAGSVDLLLMLFVFAAAFALVVNLIVGWTIVKGNPKMAGGAVAHIGMAIMFFGFVSSSRFGGTETVSLPVGTPTHALGYTLTYMGQRPTEDGKFKFDVRVEKDGHTITLSPVMFNSEYMQNVMRNPDIANLKDRDFYLAPLGLEESGAEAGGPSREMLVVEASIKPLINLVWAGLIILLVGVAVTIVRRAGDVKVRGIRAGALRTGNGDDADAELVRKSPAGVRGDPEESDSRTGEQKEESL